MANILEKRIYDLYLAKSLMKMQLHLIPTIITPGKSEDYLKLRNTYSLGDTSNTIKGCHRVVRDMKDRVLVM